MKLSEVIAQLQKIAGKFSYDPVVLVEAHKKLYNITGHGSTEQLIIFTEAAGGKAKPVDSHGYNEGRKERAEDISKLLLENWDNASLTELEELEARVKKLLKIK